MAARVMLDKDMLRQTLTLTALRVPVRLCNTIRMAVAKHSFSQRTFKPVVDDPRTAVGEVYGGGAGQEGAAAGTMTPPPTKLILLGRDVSFGLDELPERARSVIAEHGIERVHHNVEIGYDAMTVAEVVDAWLPAGLVRQSAFETIGHIAHMNLRDEVLPYRFGIGEAVLDKNARIETVVHKLSTIDNTFRNFDMEVIAGVPRTETTVRESGCEFSFDFAKVYWNSRLSSEHERLVALFTPSDVIADMFAGVGPFAVPAAKMGAVVHANDLNPASAAALAANADANGVGPRLTTYNMDGREFVAALIANRVQFTQVAMNLPAIAPEFLDAFVGAFPEEAYPVLPRIHCYCFSKEDDWEADVMARVTRVLGRAPDDASVRIVRSVAPKKVMLCISLSLPRDLAYSRKRANDDDEGDDAGPSAKRAKGL